MSRSLPPYGFELRQWLQADKKPARWGCNGFSACVTVCIGATAWSWAKQWHGHRLILVLPPNEPASKFDWRDCAGHDPILVQRCGTVTDGVIKTLTHSLMRDGVERVLDVASMDRFEVEAVSNAA
jgi:hypothetical protein